MKTSDEKLKATFKKSLEPLRGDVPDFELMWQEAGKGARRKVHVMWKAAACIALLITAGTLLLLNGDHKEGQLNSSAHISNWQEPTKNLMPAKPGVSLTTLTTWTSPTDFLLTEHLQNFK
ncbi:hypothetical protein [Haliscomenobacter sp.]|uniref:hypothetical protein n=1 Tax=Haliscomenobacter sp. TaxID=2717303 RepID=UPI003BAA00FC